MKNKTRDLDGFMLGNLRGNPYGLGRVIIYIAEREFEPKSEYAGIPRMLLVPGTLGKQDWSKAATVLIREKVVVEGRLPKIRKQKVLKFIKINRHLLLRYWQKTFNMKTPMSTKSMIYKLKALDPFTSNSEDKGEKRRK